MSNTSIPVKVKLKLWTKSAGRCQFRGCNELLYRDNLTHAEMNKAYIAHIVADSPGGVRGDEKLSPKLAKEFSNLMLLCDTHLLGNGNTKICPSFNMSLRRTY
ncbi:MAG: hypothetical protein AAFQ14_02515 [Cyanobacteria bacterium J06621_12]